MIYSESKKFVPLVGTRFTAEEVRARQPDTGSHQDPDEMSDDEPASKAAGDSALRSTAKPKPAPKVDVSTRTVTLKSGSAASSSQRVDNADVADLPDKPKATSSSAKPLPKATKMVRSYFMDDHIPEYEYTIVVNADHEEVPGILFNGTAYEL